MARAARWGLGLFVIFLATALGLEAATVLPWEVAVAILPLGALVLWRAVAGQRISELLVRRGIALSRLALVGFIAAAYASATVTVAVLLGVRGGATTPVVPAMAAALLPAVLVGGLLTALPEEITFRGFYLRTLTATAGVGWGLAASSLLFSLAHLPNALFVWELPSTLLAARLVQLAAFGALMAWAAIRTGTVWVPVLWHAGSNVAHVVGDATTGLLMVSAWHLGSLLAVAGEGVLLWILFRLGAVPVIGPAGTATTGGAHR